MNYKKDGKNGAGMASRMGLPKRKNKRKAPMKYDMWDFLYLRGIKYSITFTSVKVIKKAFIENGGMEWWENK